LRLDTKFVLIHIIEEQNGTEYRGLTNTLRSNEMHIAIELNFCVWHMGTINEYDLIEVSHLWPPRQC